MKTTLLIIDVQREMIEKSKPAFKAGQLFSCIHEKINKVRLAQTWLMFSAQQKN